MKAEQYRTMKIIFQNVIYLALLITLLPGSMAIARNHDSEDVDELRQKIESVREQTREQAEQLAQSRASKEKLELLVECSWKMLKGYEECEAEFDKAEKSYLSCVNKAKSTNRQCTDEANEASK